MTIFPAVQRPYYPPYGRMIKEWEDLLGGGTPSPGHWKNAKDWPSWLDGMATLLSHVLWPRYDKVNHLWQGSAERFKHELTLADFDLLRGLRPIHEQEIVLDSATYIQKDLFILEDVKTDPQTGVVLTDRGPDQSLRRYLAGTTDQSSIDMLAGGYLAGVDATAGDVDLEMKQMMQRPRAYQMCFLLGQDWFTHQDARTAVTPSMISGHCFETTMGGVASYYKAQDLNFSTSAMRALSRHTVDVGDRRVFAGVHYPSDNISSWLTALLICPHVCSDSEGRRWAWEAITNHSKVYEAIAGVATEGSPYEQALTLLAQVGSGEITSMADALDFALSRVGTAKPGG